MILRLLILLSLLDCAPARANDDAYLILSDITWVANGTTRTYHPVVATRVDKPASLTISDSPKDGQEARPCKLDFVCRKKPSSLQFDMQLSLGPEPFRKLSHTSGTLIEGQRWEASIDGADSSSVEYQVTAWKIPAGQRFTGRDADGKPVFEARP